jgi:hypothetical protein
MAPPIRPSPDETYMVMPTGIYKPLADPDRPEPASKSYNLLKIRRNPESRD